MPPGERWRARAATLEAMVLLARSRWLIARVPFARWRGRLGTPASGRPGDAQVRLPENLASRRLARAVERAAARLPGESRCLPKAMALQAMMRRRGYAGVLTIGVAPGVARGSLDDLHAWVTSRGEVLVGASDQLHYPLYAAAFAGKADRK